MAAQVPFQQFDSSKEDWVSYTERLEAHFEANDIPEEAVAKRRAILFSVCGSSTYQLIRNLVAPDPPTEKTFTELVEVVKRHYNPKRNVTLERYNFNSRLRHKGESVSAYVAELRRLTEHCQFGRTLEDMLRDRLVCGIQDKRIQRRLLMEPNLTYKRALDLAQAMESAEKGTQDLPSQEEEPADVHGMWSAGKKNSRLGKEKPPEEGCYRCGGKHHPSKCYHKESECLYCKKKGHLARVCRKAASDKAKPSKQKSKPKASYRLTDDENTSEEEDEAYSLHAIRGKKTKPYVANFTVQGSEMSMEVDTGASLSVISESTYYKLWPSNAAPKLLDSEVKLRTYTGDYLKVLGEIEVEVHYKRQCHTVGLVVVTGNGPSLVGRDWLAKFKLDWGELYYTDRVPEALQGILHKYQAVFRDELGMVKGMKAKIHMKENAKPRFFRHRSVPHSLKGKVEAVSRRQASLNQFSFPNGQHP